MAFKVLVLREPIPHQQLLKSLSTFGTFGAFGRALGSRLMEARSAGLHCDYIYIYEAHLKTRTLSYSGELLEKD